MALHSKAIIVFSGLAAAMGWVAVRPSITPQFVSVALAQGDRTALAAKAQKILAENCYTNCHNKDDGTFDATNYQTLLAKFDGDKVAVKPGKPDESDIIRQITGTRPAMPKGGFKK